MLLYPLSRQLPTSRSRRPGRRWPAAFQNGLIEYSDDWIELVDLRNETVHTYDEAMAEKVYQKLPAALNRFREILSALDKQFS